MFTCIGRGTQSVVIYPSLDGDNMVNKIGSLQSIREECFNTKLLPSCELFIDKSQYSLLEFKEEYLDIVTPLYSNRKYVEREYIHQNESETDEAYEIRCEEHSKEQDLLYPHDKFIYTDTNEPDHNIYLRDMYSEDDILILKMPLLEGTTVTNFLSLPKTNEELLSLAKALYQVYCDINVLMSMGIYVTDLHGGNLIFNPLTEKIKIIDLHGIVIHGNDNTLNRSNINHLLYNIIRKVFRQYRIQDLAKMFPDISPRIFHNKEAEKMKYERYISDENRVVSIINFIISSKSFNEDNKNSLIVNNSNLLLVERLKETINRFLVLRDFSSVSKNIIDELLYNLAQNEY